MTYLSGRRFGGGVLVAAASFFCAPVLRVLFRQSFTTSSVVSAFVPQSGVTRQTAAYNRSLAEDSHCKQALFGIRGGRDTTSMRQSNIFEDLNEEEDPWQAGTLEALKQREAELAALLAQVRAQKASALQSRPLTMGVVGFGRFGQFIARTFAKYGPVVVTSRSDYTTIATGMGVQYVPLSDPAAFFAQDLDVVVFAVSILSFRSTVTSLVPHLEQYLNQKQAAQDAQMGGAPLLNGAAATSQPRRRRQGPLMVDVLSVKEHARKVMLQSLPLECDILCTHPMFGPDSGKYSWKNLNFVYERTRIDTVVLDEMTETPTPIRNDKIAESDQPKQSHVEGMDRMERFLSIWEEEGCRMVPMRCRDHDAYAANSQFVTHLVGRVLGNQGLVQTPIDTSGFQSVLELMDRTTADSFELFYGLYKYNENSWDTIRNLQTSMQDVVDQLQQREGKEHEEREQQQGVKLEQHEQQQEVTLEQHDQQQQGVTLEQHDQQQQGVTLEQHDQHGQANMPV